jgi:hypothetical protein
MSNEKFPLVTELGGRTHQIRRLIDPADQTWSATNASIGYSKKEGYAVTLRSSNYVIMPSGEYRVTTGTPSTIKSRIYFSKLKKDFTIEELHLIDVSKLDINIDRGLEDPKLYWRDGSWHFTCVVMEEGTYPRARMATCRLEYKNKKYVAKDLVVYAGIDSARPEKNWMLPYEPNPNFDFVYGPNAIWKDGKVVYLATDATGISALRGNSNLHLLKDGTYLAVTHRMFGKSTSTWVPQTFGTVNVYLRRYVHYFTQIDNTGKIIAMSKGFNFFEHGVEFAAGLVEHKDDFVISWGKKDISSHIAFLPKDTVFKSLTPIEY